MCNLNVGYKIFLMTTQNLGMTSRISQTTPIFHPPSRTRICLVKIAKILIFNLFIVEIPSFPYDYITHWFEGGNYPLPLLYQVSIYNVKFPDLSENVWATGTGEDLIHVEPESVIQNRVIFHYTICGKSFSSTMVLNISYFK